MRTLFDWMRLLFIRFVFFNFSNFNFIVILRVLIVFAAITKSAQIPFCAWLPDAVAAPTPVWNFWHLKPLQENYIKEYLHVHLFLTTSINATIWHENLENIIV